MKKNKEILDEFGRILIEEVVDPNYGGLRKAISNGFKNPTMAKYNVIFAALSSDQKKLLAQLMFENVENVVFDFLRIIEENAQFKLYYENNGQRVDLVQASENLKSEPIIENGWIMRFSQERK